MDKQKVYIVACLLLLPLAIAGTMVVLPSPVPARSNYVIQQSLDPVNVPRPADYATHPIIDIESPADLAAFPGNGTPTNPKMISGYSFTGSYTPSICILIQNVYNDCIVIANCYFVLNGSDSVAMGVDASNVVNLTVTNNVFSANRDEFVGVLLWNTTDVAVSGNVINSPPDAGTSTGVEAYMNNSRLSIVGNTILSPHVGIFVGTSTPSNVNINITGNYISRSYRAMDIYSSQTVIIASNSIVKVDPNGYPIGLTGSSGVSQVNNTYIAYPSVTLTVWPLTSNVLNTSSPVTFQGNCTGGNPPLTYQWTCNDSQAINSTYKSTAQIQFSTAGWFKVVLTITDADGDTATANQIVNVSSSNTSIAGYPLEFFSLFAAMGVIFVTWQARRKKFGLTT